MKFTFPPAKCLAVSLIFASLATTLRATVILSDDFTSATKAAGNAAPIVSAATWYTLNGSAGGAATTLATDTTHPPLAGNVMQFTGGSSNGGVVASFTSLTLLNPGDYISVSMNYRYPTSPSSGYALLGLYYDNGTPVTANSYGSQTEILGDSGYKVQKLATSGSSDLTVRGTTVSAGNPYFTGGSALTTATTGVTPSANTDAVYTLSLTITLASNGVDLLLDSSFGSTNTTQVTILGLNVLTYTFNEVVFSPTLGGGGTTYADNFLITTNVPEPTTWGMIGVGMMFTLFLRRRRSSAA